MAIATVDPLIGGLAYYAAIQTKILKDNLKNLQRFVQHQLFKLCVNDASKYNQLILKRLKFCIEHHKAILYYVKYYEKTFTPIIFPHLTAGVVIICVSWFRLALVIVIYLFYYKIYYIFVIDWTFYNWLYFISYFYVYHQFANFYKLLLWNHPTWRGIFK